MAGLSVKQKRRRFAFLGTLLFTAAAVYCFWRFGPGRPKPFVPPASARYLVNRAVSVKDESPEEALRLLDEALTKDPDLEDIPVNKAVILRSVGRFEAAAEAMGKAIELDPANPLYHRFLGTCLKRSGDEVGAKAAYEETLRLYDRKLEENRFDRESRIQREKTAFLLGDEEAPKRLYDHLLGAGEVLSATDLVRLLVGD